jgi:hypothetical protein
MSRRRSASSRPSANGVPGRPDEMAALSGLGWLALWRTWPGSVQRFGAYIASARACTATIACWTRVSSCLATDSVSPRLAMSRRSPGRSSSRTSIPRPRVCQLRSRPAAASTPSTLSQPASARLVIPFPSHPPTPGQFPHVHGTPGSRATQTTPSIASITACGSSNWI